jgi:hypothetical protein
MTLWDWDRLSTRSHEIIGEACLKLSDLKDGPNTLTLNIMKQGLVPLIFFGVIFVAIVVCYAPFHS